jgi:hypothetical protein
MTWTWTWARMVSNEGRGGQGKDMGKGSWVRVAHALEAGDGERNNAGVLA